MEEEWVFLGRKLHGRAQSLSVELETPRCEEPGEKRPPVGGCVWGVWLLEGVGQVGEQLQGGTVPWRLPTAQKVPTAPRLVWSVMGFASGTSAPAPRACSERVLAQHGHEGRTCGWICPACARLAALSLVQ